MDSSSASSTEHETPVLQPVGLPALLLRLLYVPADNPAYRHQSPLRLWVFLCLMASPFVWVAWGMFIVHDYRVTIALYALLCCLLPALILAREETGLRFRPLGMPWRYLCALSILSTVLLFAFWYHFSPQLISRLMLEGRLSQIRLTQNQFWPFAFYMVVVNPFIEELFWRGLVYRELTRVTRPIPALFISAFFFGLWHWLIIQYAFPPVYVPFVMAMIIFGGVVLTALYRQTGTLLAPVLMHSLGVDLPLVIMLYQCLHYR